MPKGSRHVPWDSRIALRKSSAVNSSQWVESLACGHSGVEPKNKTNEISSLRMGPSEARILASPPIGSRTASISTKLAWPRQGPSYSGNHPVSQNQAMISPAPHEETELSAVADYNR